MWAVKRGHIVLISTYWNVNPEQLLPHIVKTTVLISTYWNVNTDAKDFAIKIKTVLISTYWNVNERVELVEMINKSFNLNLLECKSVRFLRYGKFQKAF